jgi:hypothetical protein
MINTHSKTNEEGSTMEDHYLISILVRVDLAPRLPPLTVDNELPTWVKAWIESMDSLRKSSRRTTKSFERIKNAIQTLTKTLPVVLLAQRSQPVPPATTKIAQPRPPTSNPEGGGEETQSLARTLPPIEEEHLLSL